MEMKSGIRNIMRLEIALLAITLASDLSAQEEGLAKKPRCSPSFYREGFADAGEGSGRAVRDRTIRARTRIQLRRGHPPCGARRR